MQLFGVAGASGAGISEGISDLVSYLQNKHLEYAIGNVQSLFITGH